VSFVSNTFRPLFHCVKGFGVMASDVIVGRRGLMRLCADYQQQVKNLVMAAYKDELTCA
jgi:hypothetical protein